MNVEKGANVGKGSGPENRNGPTGASHFRGLTPFPHGMSLLVMVTITAFVAILFRSQGLLERSMWFDEAMSWRTSVLGWLAMFESIKQNTHAPLYFIVLKCWILLFGESLFSLRGLNLVIVALTMPVIWMLAGQITDQTLRKKCPVPLVQSTRRASCSQKVPATFYSQRRVYELACILALFFATHPYQIRLASEVRMYPLVVLLSLVLFSQTLRVIDLPSKRRRWMWMSVASLGLLYTHYFGLFVVAANWFFLVGWLMISRPPPRQSPDDEGSVRSGVILGLVILIAGISPWAPAFLAQRANVASGWWIGAFQWDAVGSVLLDLSTSSDLVAADSAWVVELTVLAAMIVVSTLAIGGIAFGGTVANRYIAWMIVVPAVLAIGYSAVGTNLVVARYFAPVQSAFLIGVALVIAGCRVGIVRYALAVGVILLSVYVQQRHRSIEDVTARPGVRQAMMAIEQEAEAGEWILSGPPMVYMPALYHASNRDSMRLVVGSGEVSFYTGGPVLRDAEFVRRRDLDRYQQQRIWLLSNDGAFGGRLYSDWQPQRRWYFNGTHPYQETLMVTEMVRTGSQDQSDRSEETQ